MTYIRIDNSAYLMVTFISTELWQTIPSSYDCRVDNAHSKHRLHRLASDLSVLNDKLVIIKYVYHFIKLGFDQVTC